ncbi:MAG: hypothetical protein NC093_06810 [Alistipes sp.]|nr:hypothetical protein [Alistipes sp.]
MNLIKKIAACSLTAVLAMAAFVPLTSSASLIVPGADPNGDGVIDIADATFIYQVLAGRYLLTNYTPLNVDGNGIVSEADAMICMFKDAGVIK